MRLCSEVELCRRKMFMFWSLSAVDSSCMTFYTKCGCRVSSVATDDAVCVRTSRVVGLLIESIT